MFIPDLYARLKGVMTVDFIEPAIRYGTREQETDRHGVPMWRITCIYKEEGRKSETVAIKVPAPEMPPVLVGAVFSPKTLYKCFPYVRGERIGYALRVQVKDLPIDKEDKSNDA